MEVASVALVVAALGVTFGWQPSHDDPQAYEVLMQVEPELVDMLHDGQQIPIESHVPASVTPIRTIRVVVGTDKLPRTPIASTRIAKTQAERIVRGQEAPIERTARFQSDVGWSGDRYAQPTATSSNPATSASRQFDRRGATIGVEPIRTAQASPWTLDGAQRAATNAGKSLPDSMSSGIQQANQQLSQGGQQALDSGQSAGRDFGQQLQSMTGFGGQSAPPPTTASAPRSSRPTWPAPPPLATSSQSPQSPPLSPPVNRTTTPDTWSSIQPQLAPPRLRTPKMTSAPRIASNPPVGGAATGPSFPPPPTTASAPPLHSVLSDPTTTSQRAAEQNWASAWGTNGTTSSTPRDADAGVGLEPVPPRVRTSAPPPVTNNNSAADRWGWSNPPSNSAPSRTDERYNQPAAAAPVAQTNPAADAWANFGSLPGSAANNAPPDRYSQQFQPQTPAVAGPVSQPVAPPADNRQATIGVAPTSNQQAQQARAANADELPWKPLLAVSLALAASLGANFFLGVSYADTRHRYLSLVAKTTHAFQKEAGIAA